MQFQVLLGLAAMTAVSSAVQISADHPDGTFTWSPEKGEHVQVAAKGDASPAKDIAEAKNDSEDNGKSSAKFRRGWFSKDPPETKCWGGTLDRADVTGAASNLGDTCNQSETDWILPRGYTFSKYGDVVVYMCNYAKSKTYCTGKGINRDIRKIHDKCKGQSGWVHHPETEFTYGFNQLRYNFCDGLELS